MPRDLPVANGHLLANFDANYLLRDLYWPHIGERNHTQGELNRAGVWVDGSFVWLDAPEWQRSLTYDDDTLVTKVTLRHPGLAITLDCADCVDFDRDILVRRARVTNEADQPRAIRLFYHHDWHIGESDGANTVCYRPDLKAVVAYKDRCYILVNGLVTDVPHAAAAPAPSTHPSPYSGEVGIYHWATGYKEFNGQQGTWLDAEDGELQGNPIAQGSVDSCVGLYLGAVPAHGSRLCYHWLAFGPTFSDVCTTNTLVLERGPQALITRTANYWRAWLRAKDVQPSDLPAPLIDLYRRSLLIIRTQIDSGGAIVAATDGDVWSFARDSYAYMWPRDGSLVANVMSHAGYGDITGAFFTFCARAVTKDGYLLHKYTPAGALGSSWEPWMDTAGNFALPIQEDGSALAVYALWQHFNTFHEIEFVRPLYRPLVKACADFMVRYRDDVMRLPLPSWDLWEERRGIHAYTVAAVYAGLRAAAEFARIFGEANVASGYDQAADEIKIGTREFLWDPNANRFARTLTTSESGEPTRDLTIDASLSGLYQFGMFDAASDEMRATMDAVLQRLQVRTLVGGLARYEDDHYHQVSSDVGNVPGNPWFICGCWYAEYLIARAASLAELREALPWLEWVRARALPSGVLAEQVNPYTDAPLSVSPLTWSHAEFAGAIRWYIGKYQRLVASTPALAAAAETTAQHP